VKASGSDFKVDAQAVISSKHPISVQQVVPEKPLKNVARFIPPMRPKMVPKLPDNRTKWLLEPKLDGYRVIAVKSSGNANLYSMDSKEQISFASRRTAASTDLSIRAAAYIRFCAQRAVSPLSRTFTQVEQIWNDFLLLKMTRPALPS
jgi:hypothetical protein